MGARQRRRTADQVLEPAPTTVVLRLPQTAATNGTNAPITVIQNLPLAPEMKHATRTVAIATTIPPSASLTGVSPSSTAPAMIAAKMTASTDRLPSSDQYTSSR